MLLHSPYVTVKLYMQVCLVCPLTKLGAPPEHRLVWNTERETLWDSNKWRWDASLSCIGSCARCSEFGVPCSMVVIAKLCWIYLVRAGVWDDLNVPGFWFPKIRSVFPLPTCVCMRLALVSLCTWFFFSASYALAEVWDALYVPSFLTTKVRGVIGRKVLSGILYFGGHSKVRIWCWSVRCPLCPLFLTSELEVSFPCPRM